MYAFESLACSKHTSTPKLDFCKKFLTGYTLEQLIYIGLALSSKGTDEQIHTLAVSSTSGTNLTL